MKTKTLTLPYTPVSLSTQEASLSSPCIIYKIEVRLLESYYQRKMKKNIEEQSKAFYEFNEKLEKVA